MIPALLGALTTLLAFGLAYGLPGRLLVDLLVPDAEPEERLPFALALGLAVVNLVAILAAGLAGLAARVYLTGWLMWALSAAVTAVLLLLRLRLRGRDFRDWIRRPTRLQAALWAFTAVATTFYLAWYDGDLFWEESCMVRASSAVHAPLLDPELLKLHSGEDTLSRYQADPLKGHTGQRNHFLAYNQGEPLGPTVLLAPFLALFGALGYRVLFALQGLLLPAAGFLLARRVLGRGWAAWASALLLAFSPYALEARTFDENFMASAFGTVALVMLLRPNLPLVAAALVATIYVGLRQPLVVMVPFLLAFVARSHPRRGRAAAAFLGVMALAGLPFLIKHVLFVTTQGGTLFEGAFERPLAPHRLFGWEFDLRVLLGWPFVEDLVRSPYNAYPTLLAFPMDLLRRFGLVAAALVPAGVAWLAANRRREAWLMAAWTLPLMALLMVQSNWIEPNKMGVPATALAPMVLAVVAGGILLADRGVPLARKGVLAALGVVLPLAFLLGVRDFRAPLDTRVFGYPLELYDKIYPPGTVRYLQESEPFVEWDRERLRPGLLPHWPLEGLHPALASRSLSRLGDALARPGFEDYDRSVPDLLQQAMLGQDVVMGPVTLMRLLHGGPPPGTRLRPLAPVPPDPPLDAVLDLSRPFLSDDVLRAGSGDGPVLIPGGPEPLLVTGIRVPWADRELTLLAARDDTGVVFLYLMPGTAAPSSPGQRVDVSGMPSPRIHLRLAEGDRVRLIDVRVLRPARWYSRWAIFGPAGPWLSPPRALSPT